MKRAALAVMPLVLLTACGGGSSMSAAEKSSQTSKWESEANSASIPGQSARPQTGNSGTPPSKSVTYTCDGGGVKSVTVTSSGNDVSFVVDGTPTMTATQFTEFVVTIDRADGNKVQMLYQTNNVDGTTELSTFDMGQAKKIPVPGGSESGTQKFPDALEGFGSQDWHGNAAVNVDGTDIARCS